jgi:glycosyltransferase involved in cell wall biosynthesis
MKKIIYLNGRFVTQSITGVQRTAYEIVSALDKLIDKGEIDGEKIEFRLIYSGVIINPIELKHIKLIKKGILKGNLWEQFELPFYTGSNLLISMCTVSTLFKRNQVVFVHDASFAVNPQFFSFLFRTWYNFAISMLGKITRQIITVSNFSKSELNHHVGISTEKIAIIYNAADHILTYGDPDDQFKQKINALKPYCLAVSSLSANKNFSGLSEAVQQIDFEKYHMLIAGGVASTLQQATPDPSVTYLGYVTNAELKYLYTNASLFLFPSFYEGFGIPPLEAMLCGCPAAVSNTSSLPEILGDAVAYFNPYEPDSIAHKINTLLNNPTLLAVLKHKGYDKATQYNWKKSALQLFNIIRSI